MKELEITLDINGSISSFIDNHYVLLGSTASILLGMVFIGYFFGRRIIFETIMTGVPTHHKGELRNFFDKNYPLEVLEALCMLRRFHNQIEYLSHKDLCLAYPLLNSPFTEQAEARLRELNLYALDNLRKFLEKKNYRSDFVDNVFYSKLNEIYAEGSKLEDPDKLEGIINKIPKNYDYNLILRKKLDGLRPSLI